MRVVRQYMRIKQEDVVSLTHEPVGEDEEGIEFWLQFKDGTKEGHQCKARNADKEYWTVSDLGSKDIFKKAKFHLNRDPNIKYVFVSAVPNTLLKDRKSTRLNSSHVAISYA